MNWGYVLRRLYRQNRTVIASCILCWLRVIICCFLPVFVAHASLAPPADSTGKLIEYLAQEKTNLTIIVNESRRPSDQPSDQRQLKQRIQQNKAMLTLMQAKIASLDSFLINQRKQQQNLTNRLKKLQQSPFDKAEVLDAEEKISKINTLNAVNNKTIELIKDNLALARLYQNVLSIDSRQLGVWQAKFDEQQRLDELRKRIRVLEEARGRLYNKNIKLQQEKKSDAHFNATLYYETKLLLTNQAIILIQYRITELELQKGLIKAEYLSIRHQDIKTTQAVTETYKSSINQLVMIETSLKKMIELLKREQLLTPDSHLKQQLFNIQKTASLRLLQLTAQQQRLQADLEKKQQQLKKLLSIRQGLTEYHLESWPSIANQLLLIPSKFYNYLKSLAVKVKDNYVWQDLWSTVLYWVTLGLIFMVAGGLRHILKAVTVDKERSRLSGHLYAGVLILLYRNVPHLLLLFSIIATFSLNHVPFIYDQLLVNLLLVLITFRSLILVARLALLESISDSSGQDVKLYYRLKWLLLMGGWATALMVFSHQLPLSLLLQDIFNRLFMLFLLAVALVVWKSRDVIPYLLRPILRTKRRYFRNAVSLLAVLVPLVLLTTAIIGLVGYIHLAWTLSRYQAYLLLLITCYVLVRGLIFDALELLSEWMISSLHNGWLWIEVILKPLDKILRVFLLLASIVILFQLFGWYSDALIMESLKTFGYYPLVDISGVHITLVSILEFVILLSIFIWASKWTREFCYRWLYRNVIDAGIRNSFSVFTQYAVILMGGFITLRVLGLDFSGMSMVLGGLAVGMGFGLRDFASNIVGGVMLLIERPVREGDLITLGEYEGRVAHIGIRSMRVSSWDNMEVLIPNAETFNKPFTNWTHQDSIVRTVVPIKLSRADDPVLIQQLIADVLTSIPEIVSEPPSQVLLKQIDDALIEFEVRYFINVQLHTRFEIRSKVLFAITAQFKTAGIKPPIPPFSVELKGSQIEMSKEGDRIDTICKDNPEE